MIHHNGVVLEYEIIANVFNGNKVSLMKLLEKKACTNIIILSIILLCYHRLEMSPTMHTTS